MYIEFCIEMPPPPPPPPPAPGPPPASTNFAPPAGHLDEIRKFKDNPAARLKHNPIRNDRSIPLATGK